MQWKSFLRIVARCGGDSGVMRLSCTEQFRVMAFGHLTWRESLRDSKVTVDHRGVVEKALTGEIVFQMERAAPVRQEVSW